MHQQSAHSFNTQANHSTRNQTVLNSTNLRTACGGTLTILPKAQEHLRAHPDVLDFLPEAIASITLPKTGFMATVIDMGRVIGKCGTVETQMGDVNTPMLFAKRSDRRKPSRVVPPDTFGKDSTTIVVLAYPSRHELETYIFVTAWVGSLAQKEPWDPNISSEAEFSDCINYWCSNALVYDSRVMGDIFESTWAKILEGNY
jgi:hypothetical protein